MGITSFDVAPSYEFELGHLRGRWTLLGHAAGSVTVGVSRIQIPAGGWSTPAHQHGRGEEIFYVLAGRGLSWLAGKTAEVGAGDCIIYPPRGGAHTLHALEDVEVLAFGPRERDESPGFPRLEMSLISGRAVDSGPGSAEGAPIQFIRESKLGPPELPEPGPRPSKIVNLRDVEPRVVQRPRISRTRRNLALAAGSVTTGLQHVEVDPGKLSAPAHCHSLEEELFVILGGEGVVVIGDEETPVAPGDVVARPAGTGIAHVFRAGDSGLTYLAYGTREAADICYYPHSNKINFGGVKLIARLEKLDYWDGED